MKELAIERRRGIRPQQSRDDLQPFFESFEPRPDIEQSDARRLPLDDESVDFVFMDPPYADHLKYSDQRVFFADKMHERAREIAFDFSQPFMGATPREQGE